MPVTTMVYTRKSTRASPLGGVMTPPECHCLTPAHCDHMRAEPSRGCSWQVCYSLQRCPIVCGWLHRRLQIALDMTLLPAPPIQSAHLMEPLPHGRIHRCNDLTRCHALLLRRCETTFSTPVCASHFLFMTSRWVDFGKKRCVTHIVVSKTT